AERLSEAERVAAERLAAREAELASAHASALAEREEEKRVVLQDLAIRTEERDQARGEAQAYAARAEGVAQELEAARAEISRLQNELSDREAQAAAQRTELEARLQKAADLEKQLQE